MKGDLQIISTVLNRNIKIRRYLYSTLSNTITTEYIEGAAHKNDFWDWKESRVEDGSPYIVNSMAKEYLDKSPSAILDSSIKKVC